MNHNNKRQKKFSKIFANSNSAPFFLIYLNISSYIFMTNNDNNLSDKRRFIPGKLYAVQVPLGCRIFSDYNQASLPNTSSSPVPSGILNKGAILMYVGCPRHQSGDRQRINATMTNKTANKKVAFQKKSFHVFLYDQYLVGWWLTDQDGREWFLRARRPGAL